MIILIYFVGLGIQNLFSKFCISVMQIHFIWVPIQKIEEKSRNCIHYFIPSRLSTKVCMAGAWAVVVMSWHTVLEPEQHERASTWGGGSLEQGLRVWVEWGESSHGGTAATVGKQLYPALLNKPEYQWTMWGLWEPTLCTVRNLCITLDSPKT